MNTSDIRLWLPIPRIPDERLTVLCLPYAGGGIAPYHGFRAASARLQMLPVLLPGREKRIVEQPLSDLRALVHALAEVVEQACRGPYAIFGHSLGAMLAYEVACELRERGHALPQHLFLSGRAAPRSTPAMAPARDSDSDAAFVAMLREYAGTPPQVLAHRELWGLVLPSLRADFGLSEGYRYVEREPLPIPFSVLGGDRDPFLARADLDAWQEHTSEAFDVAVFPGDHFFAFEGPGCHAVVAYVERQLGLRNQPSHQARTL